MNHRIERSREDGNEPDKQHAPEAARAMRVVSELTRDILDASAVDDVARALLKAVDPVRIHGVFLLLTGVNLGSEEGFWETAGAWERDGHAALQISSRFNAQDSLFRRLAQSDDPLIIPDLSADQVASAYLRSNLLNAGVRSFVAVPLCAREGLFGTLCFYGISADPIGLHVVGACETAARISQGTIERLWRIRQKQEMLDHISALYRISQKLLESQNADQILQCILESELFGAAGGTIALLEPWDQSAYPSEQQLVFRAAAGAGSDSILGLGISVTEGIIGWVVRENETAIVPDARVDERFSSIVDQTIDLRAHPILCAPLRVKDRVIGAIELVDVQPECLCELGRHLLNQVADQAAIAIRNQRLSQQVQQHRNSIESVHRDYVRSQWAHFLELQAPQLTGIAYDRGTFLPAQDLWHPLLEKAVSKGRPVSIPADDVHGQPVGPDRGASSDYPGELNQGSSLVAPLAVRGQVLGAMGLIDPEQIHRWSHEELDMIQEIADRVAQAIENARLLQETRASLSETERLYQATSLLSRADSAEEVIKVLAQEVQNAFGGEFSGCILRSGPLPSENILWMEKSAHWKTAGTVAPLGTRLVVAQHAGLNRLTGQREPSLLNLHDLSASERRTWKTLLHTPWDHVYAIPLISGSSWLGLIGLSCQNEVSLSPRVARFLGNLADRAAVALDSVRLYNETNRRATQMEAASKVSRAATSILNQRELLSSVVKLIRDHFGYDHVQIYLLDATGQWAVLEASTGATGERAADEIEPGHRLRVGDDSLIGGVTKTGTPRSLQAGTRTVIHPLTVPAENPLSRLALPIKIGERVVGVLDIQSADPTVFGADDIAVLSTLTDQLAVAIENARLYQEQLRTADKLREVDRLKTQFLANMSHELRTPLNSIIGFSRVILKGIDGPVTDLQRQDLEAIYNSGQLLLRLINDVLDISKIAAGKMELVYEETDLREIIEGVMTTTGALVKDKSDIDLRYQLPPELPTIIADATRLRQVLLNLLSNAVKFTIKGYVELRTTHDQRYVTIQVADTGIGIPSDKFELIFQEFEQVDGSTTRTVGGTGLGLPISRHFVEMHGGEMWVESQVGVGSIFSVQLPIAGPGLAGKRIGEPETEVSPNVILAIDDEPDVIQLYKRYLEPQNYHVVGLSQSEGALERARTLRPFAILLDLLMPRKDGWTVIQELKSDPVTQNIPIFICSIVSAAGRGFTMGASDFLVKPFSEERLLAALTQLESGRISDPNKPPRVLIIDDTDQDRRFLRRVIESAEEPYDILEARDGREGVALLQRERPDVIILDLLMPRMDGFSVLELLKQKRELRRIPVIIVTARQLTPTERVQIHGQVAALFQKGMFSGIELLEDLRQALATLGSRKHPTKR